VRLVAATHRNVAQLVDAGHFRTELYYRLHVFPLTVPPLRQRPADIPLLVRHGVRHYARHLHKCIDTIPAVVMQALTHHPWPGNVRDCRTSFPMATALLGLLGGIEGAEELNLHVQPQPSQE
jgi:transcriptional regulator with PAS, ATPase and Fis domain